MGIPRIEEGKVRGDSHPKRVFRGDCTKSPGVNSSENLSALEVRDLLVYHLRDHTSEASPEGHMTRSAIFKLNQKLKSPSKCVLVRL